jgi:hypothetical protein
MSSVHGITVFGGTFPAQIWHDYYLNAGIECEEFEPPSEGIEWSPFYGTYTTSSSTSRTETETYDSETSGLDEKYDPSRYAPGAGQKPAPAPKPEPKPTPSPPKPPQNPEPAPPAPPPPPPTGGVGGG